MSIYDNETSKIYPYLNSTVPSLQEVNTEAYILAKISQIENNF